MEPVEHDPFADGELTSAAPLSLALYELWLASRLSPQSNLGFNEALELVLEGPVDAAAMERALRSLWRRHDGMRCRFDENGRFLLAAAGAELELRHRDLSGASPEEAERQLQALRQELVTEPFDLAGGPLFRPVLWREGPLRTRVFLAGHHAVLDGWSFGVVLAELDELYRSELEGRVPDLEPAPSFFDYLSSLRRSDGKDVPWWLEQLGPRPPVLELPTDRERPPLRSFESRVWFQTLDPELFAKLRSLGAKNGASTVATLQALFAILVARVAGRSDFLLGLPLAGQPRAGLPGLVGHCVQTLPLRLRVQGEASFIDNLRNVKARVLDAQEHGDATFQEVVDRLQLGFDPSRIPLIPVAFNIDPAMENLDYGVERVGYQPVPRVFENFEVFLNIETTRERAVLQWSHNRTLFDDRTIESWGELFVHLARQVVAQPELPVDRLDAVAPSDAPILAGLRPPPPPDGPPSCVARFEAAVERHPQRLALLDDEARWTYAELDTDSRCRAQGLMARGIGSGDLVAVHAPRCASTVVDLLAILRAGAAYVPLDPRHPPERKRTILEQARPVLVLGAAEGMPPAEVDVVEGKTLQSPSASSLPHPKPEDLAYVVFTSGSTGVPKGVAIEHRTMSRLVGAWVEIPRIQPDDQMLAATTFTFDISVFEIFSPLAAGASVRIASDEDLRDPRLLRAKLEAPETTLFDATPTTHRLLVDAGWDPQTKDRLRAVTAGEPLPRDLADAMRARCQMVINGYGPTESTVFASYDVVDDGPITIGGPVPHAELHVLDAKLRPVPVGSVGELYIGGGLLAQGYFEDPERTAERFILHPEDGTRLYASGDLVRARRDGRLSYLGRNDFQVKVRGLRIELPEIETTLRAVDGVAEAVVVANRSANDAKLRAYWTGRDDVEPIMRRTAAERLPSYMVPSQWIHVDAFPVGPTGKVDRQALPEPLPAGPRSIQPPATSTEREIGRLWAEALELPLDQVSRDIDFFEAGGTSMSAISFVRGLEGLAGRRLPVSTVMTHRTIEELALSLGDSAAPEAEAPSDSPAPAVAPIRHLQASPPSTRVEGLVELRPGARRLFAIHDGDGEIIPYRALAEALPSGLGLVGVLPESLPHIPCVHTSIEAMAEAYEKRIRQAQPSGPYDLTGLCAGAVIAMEVARRLESRGEEVSSIVALDAGVPWAPQRNAEARMRAARGRSALMALRSDFRSGVRTFLRKLRNTVEYEAEARLLRLADRIRVGAFARNAERGLDQPDFLWDLTTRSIYTYAEPRYRLRGMLRAPVWVVAAGASHEGPDLPMRSWYLDRDFGWSRVTEGPVRVFEAPGGHSTMLQAPQVQAIADFLGEVLRQG